MDVNDLRAIVTVTSLLIFLGIVRWAWSAKQSAPFDEAARLPFAESQGIEGEPQGRQA